jgi:hypothetical protein
VFCPTYGPTDRSNHEEAAPPRLNALLLLPDGPKPATTSPLPTQRMRAAPAVGVPARVQVDGAEGAAPRSLR